jgi:hypothetical protein
MLVGGVIVWSGYLGESIPTVTKAIFDGKTKTLVRIPLDPNNRPTNEGPGSLYAAPPENVPNGAHRSGLDRWVWKDPTGLLHYYDLLGNEIGGTHI